MLELTPVASTVEGRAPAVLVLPGGGYEHHAPHESEPVAAWLAGLGLHAYVLRYSVAPQRFPTGFDEACTAMTQIREHGYGLTVDPERVGVLGFSAGGHLAATLCTRAEGPRRPDFALLCYPVISFLTDAHEGSARNLLGDVPTDEQRAEHSAERWVTTATPPAFLWHTADDESVSVTNSLGYAAALARAGVPCELHVFPSGRHGLGLAEDDPHVGQWTGLAEGWLRDCGWLGSRA